MTKEEFIKQHNLTDKDYRNLERFEEVRKSGIYNMYEYFGIMVKYNLNGGKKWWTSLEKMIIMGTF